MALKESERDFLFGMCRCLDKVYYTAHLQDKYDEGRCGEVLPYSAAKIVEIGDFWYKMNSCIGSGAANFEDLVNKVNIFIGKPGHLSDLDVCQRISNQVLPFLLRSIIDMQIEECFETVLLKLSELGELSGELAEQYDKISSALEVKKLKEGLVGVMQVGCNSNKPTAL